MRGAREIARFVEDFTTCRRSWRDPPALLVQPAGVHPKYRGMVGSPGRGMKGYPLNYREQSGAPSIQVSIALDGRQADIDVDYRSSTFPVMLFNGHLSASNSDVRAGDNAERHAAQWIRVSELVARLLRCRCRAGP